MFFNKELERAEGGDGPDRAACFNYHQWAMQRFTRF
jgi:hypothetical protein